MSVLNRLTLLEHMVYNLNARLQAIELASPVEADRGLGTDGDRQHLYPKIAHHELTISTAAELTCPPASP